ncbi:aldehyde dehydrogenase family protein [Oceanobacillus halotolerans]|uniref:aldehyde dehydrogenase family protein n=1 Tax=Oceanobacillus halotolerans TaxID=2663380 RepID=UPI0013DBE285|nr:aldehyde dehydrogenase family protein [Oceanobacillus halotolerans]
MPTKVLGKKMLLGGKWVNRDEEIVVRDPQDNSVISTVPKASREDMLFAIEKAKEGAEKAAAMPVHERMRILNETANYVDWHQETFVTTIAREGSKTINEARGEVARCIETLRLSAEEARRINGETIPFDQMPGHENRIGYYYRFPIGVIGAITPFNDPLNLVAHKVGPAVASGNAIIIKPSSLTPISALLLAEAFMKAGLPDNVLTVVTGSGSDIGNTMVTHPAINMVTFTGGLETGKQIAHQAGLKKMSMELGSNSPVIVLKDADIEEAARACVSGAFSAAGQNCIGVQRIYVEKPVYQMFQERIIGKAKDYSVGDKQLVTTDMGPLINEKEAKRVEACVEEARQKGANVLTGGRREGAYYLPTILSNVPENCIISHEEIFGPVVLLEPVENLDEAIEKANDVEFGLQAGIFTKNVDAAFNAARRLEIGGLMINDSSDYRIDGMPFGGVKGSGLGREGVKFAIEDMTEPKVIQLNLRKA